MMEVIEVLAHQQGKEAMEKLLNTKISGVEKKVEDELRALAPAGMTFGGGGRSSGRTADGRRRLEG